MEGKEIIKELEEEKNTIEDKIKDEIKEIEKKVTKKDKEDVKEELKFEICPINYIKNNKASVNFKNYTNIWIDLSKSKDFKPNDKNIKVFYESEIGLESFHFWIEEE